MLPSEDPDLLLLRPLSGSEGFHPIVYCRYIATADYVAEELKRRLLPRWPDLHVISITGTLAEDERQIRVAELAESPRRVLVATDCLSEGINLQEAFNAVVHYDLPWNPNRLEQREGRMDRYGQRSPAVKAVEIRRTLGISVPVESESVVEAVLRSLFLRGGETVVRQLSLFEDEATDLIGEVHRRWDEAVAREKESHTRFAQHAIKPDEVAQELEETDAALGDLKAVERFVLAACQRRGNAWRLDTRLLPKALRERRAVGVADRFHHAPSRGRGLRGPQPSPHGGVGRVPAGRCAGRASCIATGGPLRGHPHRRRGPAHHAAAPAHPFPAAGSVSHADAGRGVRRARLPGAARAVGVAG